MMIGDLSLDVTSGPERDDLIVEISIGQYTFAALSIEEGEVEISFYSNPWQVPHQIPLKDFDEAIDRGREILEGMKQSE